MPEWVTEVRHWLLQTRMARYPLATILIVVGTLAALWYFDPDFVRFLRSGGPVLDEEQMPIDQEMLP